MTEVIGRIHEVADARMPIFGVSAFLSLLILVFLHGLSAISGWFYLFAIIAVLIHIAIYLTKSQPVNGKLTEAARNGEVPENARSLQNHWDRTVVVRAILLTFALIFTCLANGL